MESIYTLYQDDAPGLQALCDKFIKKLEELQNICGDENKSLPVAHIHTLTHQLKITSQLFGEDSLSATLASISEKTRNGNENEWMNKLPEELASLKKLIPASVISILKKVNVVVEKNN